MKYPVWSEKNIGWVPVPDADWGDWALVGEKFTPAEEYLLVAAQEAVNVSKRAILWKYLRVAESPTDLHEYRLMNELREFARAGVTLV